MPVAATAMLPTEPVAAPAPPADPIASRLAAGRDLMDAPGARYAVQLMVTDAREREFLETWLAQAGRAVEPAKLVLVPAGSPEAPKVAVLLGSFGERGKAIDALETLPPTLRQFKPYVRSIDIVREDARRAQAR